MTPLEEDILKAIERPDFERMALGIIVIRKERDRESDEEDYYASGLFEGWGLAQQQIIKIAAEIARERIDKALDPIETLIAQFDNEEIESENELIDQIREALAKQSLSQPSHEDKETKDNLAALTLQEFQDKIAIKYGYVNWHQMKVRYESQIGDIEKYFNEVAELYASYKVEKAWDAGHDFGAMNSNALMRVMHPEIKPKSKEEWMKDNI